MSLASLLSIARSALWAQQRAMEVTAHNVANAQTPGYSRQRLNLRAADPLRTPLGAIGRGVTDEGITRARDTFFDAAYRRESGLASGAGTLHDTLTQIEQSLLEPSDQGVTAMLDNLFSSFSELSNDPANTAARELARQAGSRVAQTLNGLDARLGETRSDAFARLGAQVTQVNDITKRLASLNAEILSSGGSNAPDLLDRRDALVDQLSTLMSVRVIPHDDGTVGVIGGDALLVDRGSAQALTLVPQGTGFALQTSTGGALSPGAGSLSALLDLTNTRLPAMQQKLDALAQNLATEFNAVHRTGFDANGNTGQDFFDPSGVTARTIKLSPAVAASSDAIAASASPLGGDGDVAMQLSSLGDSSIGGLAGQTFRGYFTDFATAIGSDTSSAAEDADAHQALLDNADTQRTSISGVSVDEEMVQLIALQQAYQAASRLIAIADEMSKDLITQL